MYLYMEISFMSVHDVVTKFAKRFTAIVVLVIFEFNLQRKKSKLETFPSNKGLKISETIQYRC